MKNLLRPFSLALAFSIFNLFFIHPNVALAVSVEPFAPYSVEGNPDEEYQFGEIFPLFRYIPTTSLEVHENADRNRAYEPYYVCPGAGSDHRDYYCDNAKTEESGCDGGEVDICAKGSTQVDHVKVSGSVGCKLPNPDPTKPDAFVVGKCEYKQNPKISKTVKGTDFSENDTLAFSKIQSESLAYTNIGTDNVITWGSIQLSNIQDQKIINQLMVLTRAIQTKTTLEETGEWPMGWVDWGYITPNGKTLKDIYAPLPSVLKSAGKIIVEADDDFYLTGGNLEIITNVSKEKDAAVKTVNEAAMTNPQPEWVVDFLQSPLYSPSFRRGFIRPSICIWDKCCPGDRCPVPKDDLTGQKRGLYYDISVSQAYGAAMDELLRSNSLSEGVRLYKKILESNPLARYLTSAAPKATPSQIKKELDELLKGTCFDYHDWSSWASFGLIIDYSKPGDFLDPGKNCPGYDIMPEVIKETAAAKAPSLLDVIVSLFWGKKVDEVEPRVDHYITIPDAMGQSIDEIQIPVYDSYDSLADLESVKEYNIKMSNIVDDEADYLKSGKRTGPNRAKRFVSLYGCQDDMYSAQTQTNIESYATGGRVGCHETGIAAESAINCDPNVPEQTVSGLSVAAGKDYTDRLFAGCVGNSQWMQCHNDVIKRSSASGVDPLFALAIWVHESGASNYECGEIYTQGVKVQDFGININDIAENFTAQISRFLALPTSYDYCGKNMSNFIAKFWFGKCEADLTPALKQRVADYIDELEFIYEVIAPSRTLPSYPQVGPYVPSNPEPSKSPESPSPSPTSVGFIPGGFKPGTGFTPQGCGTESLATALGCIPYTRDAFTSALLTFIAGIAGAIALVVMLIATFLIMTAGGNAEQLKKGKELFTSAVVGLLFLIFSVSTLNLIAGDIIRLPGFI